MVSLNEYFKAHPGKSKATLSEVLAWARKRKKQKPGISKKQQTSRRSHRSVDSSPSSSSKPKHYYIKPGTYEGVHAIATTSSLPPAGSGWKKVTKEEYEEHIRRSKVYWARKRKEELEKRISKGDKAALKEWKEKYGRAKVTDIVTTKNPKTGEEVEIPVAKTSYGTYLYQLPESGETKELKPGIGKGKEWVLGQIAKEYHKSVLGKSSGLDVSFGSVRVEDYEKYRLAKEFAEIKKGKKSIWKTPQGKLIIVSGKQPPFGMSEKVAKERGYKKIQPQNVELKSGNIVVTESIIGKQAQAVKSKVIGKGAISIVGIESGLTGGQFTRQPKLSEMLPSTREIYKQIAVFEERRRKEEEKRKQEMLKQTYIANLQEFERKPPHEQAFLRMEMVLRNIPDFAEVTYYRVTGDKEKEKLKWGEMVTRQKQLFNAPVEEKIIHGGFEVLTEGVGAPLLGAGISRLAGGLIATVGKYSTSMAKLVDFGAKSVFVGMAGFSAGEITGDIVKGEYGKAVGEASLFGLYMSGALFEGSVIKGTKGKRAIKLKPTDIIEMKPVQTRELVDANGNTIGEISEGKIKFKAVSGNTEASITGRFISTTKNGIQKTLIEIPEQEVGGIKIKRQIINLKSQNVLNIESKGLQGCVKGKIREPIISKEGKIAGAVTREGEVIIQPYARAGISRELQITRIQKGKGTIDITRDNIDRHFKKVLEGGYTAYKETGFISRVSSEQSYVSVVGKTSRGVAYRVEEVRIKKPIRNFIDEHLVRINRNVDSIYKTVAGERSLSSKGVIAEKISKLKLKAEKLPGRRSLTEKLWKEKGIKGKAKLRLKNVEQVGFALPLTVILHKINQAQRQVLENSPLYFTIPQKVVRKPLIKEVGSEKTELLVRKQVPNVVQDLFNRLDQQYFITNAQIQQTLQNTIKITETKPTTKLSTVPLKPAKSKPKRKKAGIVPPYLPFGGVGIEALDSQYRTITRHIKHNIPRVEKLLEL